MAINYRKFTPADLDAAHRLSLAVGWPHRREDWQFVLALGAGYVAVTLNASSGPSFIGNKAARRRPRHGDRRAGEPGRGIGRVLMSLALKDLKAAIRLTATLMDCLCTNGWVSRRRKIEQHQGLVDGEP
jgi:hypothetical protein